eukprot:scaffold12.g8112.t1
MARLDLPSLHKELDGFKQRFDKWAQHTVSATEQLRDGHLRRIKELQATLRSLEQRKAELEQQAADVQQRLAGEHAELEQLQTELAKIQAEQAALPALLAEVKESLAAETEEYERTEAGEARAQGAWPRMVALKSRKLAALRQALAMYRQSLGLWFEHGQDDGERMQVVMDRIDPRDHSRRFSFAVQVVGKDTYQVPTCDPPLDGVAALVEQLNARRLTFGQFVQRVRRSFAALVRAEMQQQAGAAAAAAAATQPAAAAVAAVS